MIKSSKDTRYAIDSVVTHDGLKFPCWALPDLSSFQQKVGDEAYEKVYKASKIMVSFKQNWINLLSREFPFSGVDYVFISVNLVFGSS